MYDLWFNGSDTSIKEVNIEKRIDIPAAKQRKEKITIPGRDGDYYLQEDTWEDIEIKVEMNFRCEDPDGWNAKWRFIKEWLRGSGILRTSDDPNYQYRVKKISIEKVERPLRRQGKFRAAFLCDPYQYLISGSNFESVKNGVLRNPLNYNAYPIYKILGEGVCDLTVNGYTISANVGQNLIIDTERQLTYREDGTLQNTAIAGEYTELILHPGRNEIMITEGFVLDVQPNWRCI